MLNSTKDDMANSIGMIAQQFTSLDAQTMYQLQSGQENTTAFTALKEKMQTIRAKSPNIVNIYTMHLENDGKVTFIVDDLEAVAAAIVGYLSITKIRDIKKLNKTAEEISKGNMDVAVDVNRKDEVGDLAESFGRMVASLKFMMSEQEQNDK
jgi:HAMP domain-containing protein